MNDDYSDESTEESEMESEHPVNNPLTNPEYLAARRIRLHNSYMLVCLYLYMEFQSMSYRYNQALPPNIPPFNIGFRHLLAETIRHLKSRSRPHQPEGAMLYFIPKWWKRIAAELIDFFCLCTFRFIMHFYLPKIVEIIGLHEFLYPKYSPEMSMTTKFILSEIIHRIIVFLYEVYHLRKQDDIEHMGGATLGKIFMNLRVVKCDQVIAFEEYPFGVCWVKPGTNLDFKHVFARSFMKNILLMVLFPFWFGILLFQYNRTGYDVMCHMMVVLLLFCFGILLCQYNRTGYDVVCHTMVVEVVDEE